jgi:hypothetical protein
MAIIGAHSRVYTSEPEAVRAMFRGVFGWSHVDAGGGWSGEPSDQGWGIATFLGLPGGLELQLYGPRHPMAISNP